MNIGAGTLYLIPVTLADLKGMPDGSGVLLQASLPPAVRERIGKLDLYAAESAKSARAFLNAVGTPIAIQTIEIVEIGHAADAAILTPLVDALKAGRDVGVLAEAGCPGIADPGALMTNLAHGAGIRVVPLVGPSSILLALMASGLEGQRFAFHGYLPVKPVPREVEIRRLEARSHTCAETQIVIETPYRNTQLLASLMAALRPDTRLSIGVDLTLKSEWIAMKTIADWRAATLPNLDKRPTVFLFLAA